MKHILRVRSHCNLHYLVTFGNEAFRYMELDTIWRTCWECLLDTWREQMSFWSWLNRASMFFKDPYLIRKLRNSLHSSFEIFFNTTGAYSVVMDNFRVVANVSESFKTVSTVTCAARCAQNEKCFFFNIMTSATGSSRSVTCELVLSLSATVTESNLVPQNGWRVYFPTRP